MARSAAGRGAGLFETLPRPRPPNRPFTRLAHADEARLESRRGYSGTPVRASAQLLAGPPVPVHGCCEQITGGVRVGGAADALSAPLGGHVLRDSVTPAGGGRVVPTLTARSTPAGAAEVGRPVKARRRADVDGCGVIARLRPPRRRLATVPRGATSARWRTRRYRLRSRRGCPQRA